MRLHLALLSVVLCILTVPTAAHASAPRPSAVAKVSRLVFGRRWKAAACIAWHESRDELDPPHHNRSRGPWQIDPVAHPWVNARRLTRSWLYSARVAWKISEHGREWSAWTTARSCAL